MAKYHVARTAVITDVASAKQYIKDIQTVNKAVGRPTVNARHVDVFMRKVANYAKIRENDNVVKKSFINSVAFDKTDTFLSMVKSAKLNKAYFEFLNNKIKSLESLL